MLLLKSWEDLEKCKRENLHDPKEGHSKYWPGNNKLLQQLVTRFIAHTNPELLALEMS